MEFWTWFLFGIADINIIISWDSKQRSLELKKVHSMDLFEQFKNPSNQTIRE